jgi:intracellular sulfur oxidation DsrE/DsrF family protein
MRTENFVQSANRRDFLGKLSGAAAILGIASVVNPANADAGITRVTAMSGDPDEWFKSVKGKHRIVFDCTEPKQIFPFAWPKVFLMTNAATGSPEKDCGVVVVLRHDAIFYAFSDDLWAKYKFGEAHKIDDPMTKTAATANPFWNTKPDEFKVPGIGTVQIGIRDLQASGVMFCVCDVAITVHSAVTASQLGLDPTTLKNEWTAGLLPGIQSMPSGVWAVGRAQENGCAYCYV